MKFFKVLSSYQFRVLPEYFATHFFGKTSQRFLALMNEHFLEDSINKPMFMLIFEVCTLASHYHLLSVFVILPIH